MCVIGLKSGVIMNFRFHYSFLIYPLVVAGELVSPRVRHQVVASSDSSSSLTVLSGANCRLRQRARGRWFSSALTPRFWAVLFSMQHFLVSFHNLFLQKSPFILVTIFTCVFLVRVMMVVAKIHPVEFCLLVCNRDYPWRLCTVIVLHLIQFCLNTPPSW